MASWAVGSRLADHSLEDVPQTFSTSRLGEHGEDHALFEAANGPNILPHLGNQRLLELLGIWILASDFGPRFYVQSEFQVKDPQI